MSEQEKALISLNQEEQVMIQNICVDKDPEEAIYFTTKILALKVKKKVPCLASEIMSSGKF